jgi:hypothetical protein
MIETTYHIDSSRVLELLPGLTVNVLERTHIRNRKAEKPPRNPLARLKPDSIHIRLFPIISITLRFNHPLQAKTADFRPIPRQP